MNFKQTISNARGNANVIFRGLGNYKIQNREGLTFRGFFMRLLTYPACVLVPV